MCSAPVFLPAEEWLDTDRAVGGIWSGLLAHRRIPCGVSWRARGLSCRCSASPVPETWSRSAASCCRRWTSPSRLPMRAPSPASRLRSRGKCVVATSWNLQHQGDGTWIQGCGGNEKWIYSGRRRYCRNCIWCTWLGRSCSGRAGSCRGTPSRTCASRWRRSSPAASEAPCPRGTTWRGAPPLAWWSCRSVSTRWAWLRRGAGSPAAPACTARTWCRARPAGCGSRCSWSPSAACWRFAPGTGARYHQWRDWRCWFRSDWRCPPGSAWPCAAPGLQTKTETCSATTPAPSWAPSRPRAESGRSQRLRSGPAGSSDSKLMRLGSRRWSPLSSSNLCTRSETLISVKKTTKGLFHKWISAVFKCRHNHTI